MRGRRIAEAPDGVGRHVRAHGLVPYPTSQSVIFFLILDGLYYWKPAKRN